MQWRAVLAPAPLLSVSLEHLKKPVGELLMHTGETYRQIQEERERIDRLLPTQHDGKVRMATPKCLGIIPRLGMRVGRGGSTWTLRLLAHFSLYPSWRSLRKHPPDLRPFWSWHWLSGDRSVK